MTDRLHPLLANETRITQDNYSCSPGVAESDVTRKLATRTAALTIQGDLHDNTNKVDQKKQNSESNEQFLPPIK